jgi:hypothetical protein
MAELSEQSESLVEKINLFFPVKLREEYSEIVRSLDAEIARLKADVETWKRCCRVGDSE